MEINLLFITSFKLMAFLFAAIFLIGVCLYLLEASRLITGKISSPKEKYVLVVGLFFQILCSIAIAAGFNIYTKNQVQRKEKLVELQGISKELDKKITTSLSDRVSYIQTISIIEDATDECREIMLHNKTNNSKICSKILSINDQNKFTPIDR